MIDLQRFRRDKNLDQKQISLITGLDQSVISKYENKKHVTRHVTEVLLQKIPELESNMIQENVVSEPGATYEKESAVDKLIDNIQDLIKNNEKLIDNNTKLVEANSMLSQKILELAK